MSIRSHPQQGNWSSSCGRGARAEEARDQAGQRFAHDQAKGIAVQMAADQRFECCLDAIEGVLDGLTLGRTDGPRVLDPLTEELGIAPFDLVNLETLPEPLVEVSQLIDAFGPQAQGLAEDLGGPNHAFPRPAVKSGKCPVRVRPGEGFGQPVGLGLPTLAQRNVENALNAILLVIECRAGTDQ